MSSKEYTKTFRLKDPYSSWGDHHLDWYHRKYKKNTSINDTGLCNRLLTWDAAYNLIHKSNDLLERRILVQKRIFPEFELLFLPNTFVVDYTTNLELYNDSPESDLLHHLTFLDTETMEPKKASPITKNQLESYSNYETSSFKLRDNHVYNEWGFVNLEHKHQHFGKIKIKDEYLDSLLFSKNENMVGIHIRKGNGVKFGKEELNNFPKDLQILYTDIRGKNEYNAAYPFIPDKIYFNLIDSMLKINPDQKIFISHDLPDIFIEEYYNKYGNKHIVSRKDYRDIFIGRYKSLGIDCESIQNYCNGIDNIIDLFGLSYCNFIIPSETSTWSQFALGYKKKNIGKHSKKIESDGYGGFETQHVLDSYIKKINKTIL